MYAPVSTLVLRDMGDHLIGHAAPRAGPAPCLLRLTADDILVAAARATRFSSVARAGAVRLGWCGVKLPGLAAAAAVGRDLKVSCGVTDRVLWRRTARVPVTGPPLQAKPLTVFDIITLSRAEDGSPSLAELRPILWHHLRHQGMASFVRATYETFLARSAEQAAIDAFTGMADDALLDMVPDAVLSSTEYLENGMRMIPGPFNSAFRYGLAALDAPAPDEPG